jgi:hypothetical protein
LHRYDVIKYIWSLENFRERFAAMAVKVEREIDSEVSCIGMTSSSTPLEPGGFQGEIRRHGSQGGEGDR